MLLIDSYSTMKSFIVLSMFIGLSSQDHSASSGYSSARDGGIFSSGYISENAEFGNTFSAQNFQPSYAGGRGGNGAGGNDNIAMLEKAVPGIPGQDYPILAEVPETSFSCDGQVDGGYYGDPDAQCQVFHICTSDGQGGLSKYSFLCPNGTIFNQQYFICDWWFNFDCSDTQGLYSLNADIAAEREAATQALLASASNTQSTYVGRGGASAAPANYGAAPAPSNYGASPAPAPAPAPKPRPAAPRPAAPGGAGGSYQAPGAGNRGNNNKPAGGAPRSKPAGPNGNGAGRRNGDGGNRKAQGSGPNSRNGGAKAPSNYGAPSASNYGAPASSGYGAPAASAGSGYGAPAASPGSGYGAPASSAGSGYGAPASSAGSGYGAPASPAGSGYGAPASSAGSGYGAPASPAGSSYGSPAGSSYGGPDSEDDLPNYGK